MTSFEKLRTQEENELLLVDLSARLPYRVYISPVDCGKAILIGIKDGNPLLWDTIHKKEYDKPWDIEYIKPYLRPMSSMTEEERKEYELLANHCIVTSIGFVHLEAQILINWLNAHHFDYRGLIEKGLALEAPEDMYKHFSDMKVNI
jgi:hypothetical protein